jgi:hypothetical protein
MSFRAAKDRISEDDAHRLNIAAGIASVAVALTLEHFRV